MSKATGKRRAEELDSAAPNGPLDEIEVSDEHVKLLEDAQREISRAELALERRNQEAYKKLYSKRRPVLKSIPKFWVVALHNHPVLAFHMAHKEDMQALSFLEELWVEREEVEFRAYTLEFHFAPNPFFSDAVLKKEYKYVPPPSNGTAADTPDDDGVTQAMIDFDWSRDVDARASTIAWKDASKALTKLYPRIHDPEDADDVVEHGSFFNLFEHKDLDSDIANVIVSEVFPEAINYFFGRVENSMEMLDSEEEDEDEEDEDDEEEIDLEKPRKKKVKSS